MLAQLAEHRRRLKQVQSIERKIEVKRSFLPEYAPWIDGVLSADRGDQDDILITAMVWRIDTGDLAGAVPLVDYALRHNLVLPDQYQRDVATLVAEESAELALRQLAAGDSPDLESLLRIDELTADRDMPDEVRAKLHKALGYALRPSNANAALTHLTRAFTLHDKVGVKKDIERLEREIKHQSPSEDGG
jgi:hypothetical protein